MPRTIAVVGALSLAFEGLPADLRARRETELAHAAAELAAAGLPVTAHGVATTLEEAREAGAAIAATRPAAVLVLVTIAARADLQWALVEAADAPVLVWGRPDHATYPASASALDQVVASGPVGAQALANVLARAGRPVAACDRVALGEREHVWLRAAVLAATLPEVRLGVIGGTFPGMLDCALDRERLAADLGLRLADVELPPGPQVPPEATRMAADVAPHLERRSRRLTAALVAASDGLDGVAVRCHSPQVASHPAFGVTACHATAALAERGIVMACMGDEPTLVALLVARRLGRAAHYTEVDAYDEGRDAVLLSNGGELCAALAEPTSVRPCANRFFAGVAGRGLAWSARLRPGPATLVAFTPVAGGWRLISWEGDVTDDALADLDVPHGFFRGAPAGHEGWSAFVEAGAPHHAALAPGRLGAGCALLARLLGIDHVAIR